MNAEKARQENERWQPYLPLCGDSLREGAREGKSMRMKVIARSYLPAMAARRLGIRARVFEKAVEQNAVVTFTDPDGRIRIPVSAVEAVLQDESLLEKINAFEVLRARHIALVSGVSYTTARTRLQKAGISRTEPQWAQVRGQWGLPNTLREFREICAVALPKWLNERDAKEKAAIEKERQERDRLREQLIAAFPTWRHEGRVDQRLTLHIGPTNSGKTWQALNHLVEAGSGWYLAPLRLLAFEVFDRLNQSGTPCNLLTGEEYIPVSGAQITASTIEMFNPAHSGACVIIDEAHMLADPDRGWAWTRALMGATSREIHIIGAPLVRKLVSKLAAAADIPLEVVEYERLTPLEVAPQPWSLQKLPSRTILVAFSRQVVLGLKAELEHLNRTVSVVYGNLPPEVRRRQSDRFANGESEICVATDAVGMGLNLPADQVCFFEIQKFDGRQIRKLTAHEIRQIGGRAGRFGLSQGGQIGALTRDTLESIRSAYNAPVESLSHARVAPSVEDIAMISGDLADRLDQWATLESIPPSLKNAIKPADMTERIELARLLHRKEVQQLGLDSALQVINAPTRPAIRLYWRECVTAILSYRAMPPPPDPSLPIEDDTELEWAEACILCADVYLWLSLRHEFSTFAPDAESIRVRRMAWSQAIDDALVRKVEFIRRCADCGKKLRYDHRFSLCDACYAMRRSGYGRWMDYDDDVDDDDDEFGFALPKQKPPIPIFARSTTICPACGVEVESIGTAHLTHWQGEHPERTEVTIAHAAWLLGIAKGDVPAKVPFDRKDQDGKTSVRYWTLKTLGKVIQQDVKL